jgi:predicted amidohydrolase
MEIKMNDSIKIAAIQMVSCSSLDENLATAKKLCAAAAKQGAEIVSLPEFFVYIGENNDNYVYELAKPKMHDYIVATIANIAKENNVYIVAGSIPTHDINSTKLFNTCLVFNTNGNFICRYNKIHTFKYLSTKKTYDESINYANGNSIASFTYKNFTLGLAICSDIRFPELFRKLLGVDAFIIPSAFVLETGAAHWETILKRDFRQ